MATFDRTAPDDATARRQSGWHLLLSHVPLLALVVLVAFSAGMSDRFLSPMNLTNVLQQASVITVIAIGMTYVIVVGGFDLSVGSVTAFAGCVAAMVMVEAGVAAGVVAGVSAGVLVGLCNGLIVTQLKVSPFITTLGALVLVRGVTLLMTDGRPVAGENGLPEPFLAYGRETLFGIHYLVWTPIALFAVFAWILHMTAYGKRIFATGGNREAAFLAGIKVDRITASAYTLSGALAGVAGVMLASRLQSGQPTAGEFYELTAIAAVVLGGASLKGGEGKLYKSIIGVLIVVVLANSLNLLNVHSYWQRVVIGMVIIGAAAADQFKQRLR